MVLNEIITQYVICYLQKGLHTLTLGVAHMDGTIIWTLWVTDVISPKLQTDHLSGCKRRVPFQLFPICLMFVYTISDSIII